MKRTTTSNLMSIITSKDVKVENVIHRYSSSELDIETMEPNKLVKALNSLNDSGIFADNAQWEYESVSTSNEADYIKVYSSLGTSFTISTIEFELRTCGNVNLEEIEKKLCETIFS